MKKTSVRRRVERMKDAAATIDAMSDFPRLSMLVCHASQPARAPPATMAATTPRPPYPCPPYFLSIPARTRITPSPQNPVFERVSRPGALIASWSGLIQGVASAAPPTSDPPNGSGTPASGAACASPVLWRRQLRGTARVKCQSRYLVPQGVASTDEVHFIGRLCIAIRHRRCDRRRDPGLHWHRHGARQLPREARQGTAILPSCAFHSVALLHEC